MNSNIQNEKENLLVIKNLKKYFDIQKGIFRKTVGHIKAVNDVSLNIKKGMSLGLVGESGCGKTTLGKTILQLIKPTSGSMIYNFDGIQKDLTKLNKNDLFDLRKKVQMVFQDSFSTLNPCMSVRRQLEEPLRIHGLKDKHERKERIVELLKAVGLDDNYLTRYPNEFSGGERQRIGLARALLIQPELIVCDEPISALDVSIKAQMLNLFKEIQQNYNLTYIFITHDLSILGYICDKIAVMYLGKIVEIINMEELFGNTHHPYTQALLSAIPVPTLKTKTKKIMLEGEVGSAANPPSGCCFHPRCRYCMAICSKEQPELKGLYENKEHLVACHLYNK